MPSASPIARRGSSTRSACSRTSWDNPHRGARASTVARAAARRETGFMAHLPSTRRTRIAVPAAGAASAALLALLFAGVVPQPDLEGALTGLSGSLGAWTYALVAGLAFLETGAFVGLIAPGETAIVLGGVVAAEGDVSLPL